MSKIKSESAELTITDNFTIEICSDQFELLELQETKLDKGSEKGLNWSWRLHVNGLQNASFEWTFDWDVLQRQGISRLEGELKYNWNMKKQPIRMKREKLIICQSGISLKKELEQCCRHGGRCSWTFSFSCILKAIHFEYDYSLLEDNFSQSGMTDAVLLVEDKKLHVSKAFLSFHSQFFQDLFNSKKKTVKVFQIDNIKYEEFATFLSCVYPVPIVPTAETAAKLLKLAKAFGMKAVTSHVQHFLMLTPKVRSREKILLADEFELSDLLEQEIKQSKIKTVTKSLRHENLSAATKCKIFDQLQDAL